MVYQAQDPTCRQCAALVLNTNAEYYVNSNEIVLRQLTINGAFRIVRQKLCLTRLLYLSNYPKLEEHSKRRRMYDPMRPVSHWRNLANDTRTTVDNSQQYANRETLMKHQRFLTLFCPTNSQEFIVVDIYRCRP